LLAGEFKNKVLYYKEKQQTKRHKTKTLPCMFVVVNLVPLNDGLIN
jgi:hypothetical protein